MNVKKAKKMFNRLFKIIKLEEMQILPGQLAFFIVLAIFAIFPLIGYIGSTFITKGIVNSIENTLPSAVSTILKSLMDTKNNGIGIVGFAACSIFFASGGCEAMILTSNVIYKIKNNNIIKQKIKAIIMTLVLILLLVFIVLVPAFGDLILSVIKEHYPGRVIDTIIVGFGILKYPLSFGLIFFGVKILYTLAPDERIPSHYNNYGSLLTTILWVIITRGYAIYLNNINTYNIFYGSLANVVIVLLWIYLLAYVFTLGMALNSERYLECQKSVKSEEN